ncbi:MAG TPA: translation initiation factor IF-1 [Deltaproteobacteria bacterium]|nr:translation initiation factor IF-1 [Deltaproteobacteria bacterium]
MKQGKEDLVVTEGTIEKSKGNSFYTVRLANGEQVLARVAGRSRRITRHLFPGVDVKVEMSCYDLTRGRIVSLTQGR